MLKTIAVLAACWCASAQSITVALPGRPFAVVPSKDNQTLFVSLVDGPDRGVAVVKRSGGRAELSGNVRMDSGPTGLVLSHDGKLLIAAAHDDVVFVYTQRMSIVGRIGGGAQRIYANVTADDKLLFISEESGQSITVIDLERARANGYAETAILGKIPVGMAPIALTFSPDGKWLYTTSQGAPLEWNWPKACKPEGRNAPTDQITRPEGAIVVISVARSRTDPATAVEARIPAACSPVRMAISPKGDRIYVTARNSDSVLAFDTSKLISDPEHARLAMVPVGTAPVPIAVVDGQEGCRRKLQSLRRIR